MLPAERVALPVAVLNLLMTLVAVLGKPLILHRWVQLHLRDTMAHPTSAARRVLWCALSADL